MMCAMLCRVFAREHRTQLIQNARQPHAEPVGSAHCSESITYRGRFSILRISSDGLLDFATVHAKPERPFHSCSLRHIHDHRQNALNSDAPSNAGVGCWCSVKRPPTKPQARSLGA